MNEILRAVGYWLADYYLAATLLLALVFVAHRLSKQPALRIAISWGAAVGLLLLMAIVSLPVRPGFTINKTKLVNKASGQAVNNQTELPPTESDPRIAYVEKPVTVRHGELSEIAENGQQGSLGLNPVKTQTAIKRGHVFDTLLAIAIIALATGAMLSAAWLCSGLVAAYRFRLKCTPAPVLWTQELARLTADSRTAPVLLMNDSLGRAIVMGVRHPAIILPTEFLTREIPVAVRAVIRHELAHIEHKDLWLASLVRLSLPLLYIHPLFWWFRRQILIDQECLADEVVATNSSRTEYAENLIRWARTYQIKSRLALGTTLGLWENSQLLSQRVKVLLDDARPMATRISQSWFRCAMALSVSGAIVASLCSVRPNAAVAALDQGVLHNKPNDADFGEIATGTIVGEVVDPRGKPLANVLVDAWTWCSGNETQTDDRGRFQLTGFEPSEQVQVRFSKAGYSPQMFLDLKSGTKQRQITLSKSTYIEGKIVDSNGDGVAGAVVRANQGPKQVGMMLVRNIWSETKSDNQGRYRLFVQPDRYELEALSPGIGVANFKPMLIAAGEVRQLDLKLTQGATFHATVVDANTGEPARGVRLWAWKRPVIDATSDESGIVHINNVPLGKYRLHFESDQYARWWFESDPAEERAKRIKSDGWRREFDPKYLEISTDMPAIKIYVEPGVRISGRVVDPDGQEVEGATVAPVRTGTGNSLTGDTRYSVETNADGDFKMLLPASDSAKYNLIAHDGEYQEWRRWANGGGYSLQTQPGGKISGVELQLTRPGKIRGRVVDENGKPVANREVFARSADGRGHRYYEPEAKTASDGSFKLSHVRPSEQLVQLSPLMKAVSIKELVEGAQVTVQSGETVSGVTIVSSK